MGRKKKAGVRAAQAKKVNDYAWKNFLVLPVEIDKRSRHVLDPAAMAADCHSATESAPMYKIQCDDVGPGEFALLLYGKVDDIKRGLGRSENPVFTFHLK